MKKKKEKKSKPINWSKALKKALEQEHDVDALRAVALIRELYYLVIAQAMGAQVETDPRSTDFLKIKIGNTRINTPFARGMPQIVTLMARLATQSSKSTVTGKITQLNSGKFGSKTLFDVGIDFLVNKTTPPVGTVVEWARGRDFKGDKPTIGGTAFGYLPIAVQNFIGLKDEHTTQAVVGAFIDLFGFSSNTYSPPKK